MIFDKLFQSKVSLIIVKIRMELVKTKFDVYMMAKGRVQVQLDSLVHWMICTKYFEPLKKATKNALIYQHYFKLLILLNKLLMFQNFDPLIAETVLSNMKIYSKKNDKFEQSLMKRLLMPYKLYLQKRCLVFSEGPYEQQASCFQLLNLIQVGTSFTDMLFILGRYFKEKIVFTIDFNVVLAQDLSKLYQNITNLLFKCKNLNIKNDIEKMHEKMYAVYYSCYFHKETKKYAPRWIQTDNETLSPTPNTRTNKRKVRFNLNSNEIEHGEKESSQEFTTKESNESNLDPEDSLNVLKQQKYVSQFSINEESRRQEERDKQKERLQLLKSMERVLLESQ